MELMEEYTCKKCGEVCEIEWGDGGHPNWPDCWCDKCGDYAGGFSEIANDLSADKIGSDIDAIYERYKDDPDFQTLLANQKKRDKE